MIAAGRLDRHVAKLAIVDTAGKVRHCPRTALAVLFNPGDLVIANDAATLPASLCATHCRSGERIEIRLAAWISAGDPTRFIAATFGAGDHRTRTEDRQAPPPLSAGDRLVLDQIALDWKRGTFSGLPRTAIWGARDSDRKQRQSVFSHAEHAPAPLIAHVEYLLDHPRLIALRFAGDRAAILAGLVRHGRPIQYAHVPEPLALWDVWTKIAAEPVAFEPPSAGFALDRHILEAWQERGIGFATLTHAAGISSTGDPVLDLRLPFDEPYRIPERTAAAISWTKSRGRRVVAIGTTVVRALESAADADGSVRAGTGVARGRITGATRLRIVDTLLTGVHAPGESHFELLRAFADDTVLLHVSATLAQCGYRTHEFGDSVLIERQAAQTRS